MKRLIISAVLLLSLQHAFAQNLLDSLKGHWVITAPVAKKNQTTPGTLLFSDDGKFVSTGQPLSSLHALYRTNETTSTVFIEVSDEQVTEWKADLNAGKLTLTRIDAKKRKQSKMKIIAVRKPE